MAKATEVRRVFLIGLDCAAPELVFDRWQDDLPNLTALRRRGLWGELRSCIPAITVPAWSVMLSSRDPGALGIYGFRNRASHDYYDMFIADGRAVKEKRVWDYLGEAGRVSVLVGVPQTYPVQPVKGLLVSGFLTPSRDAAFTYPEDLREEVLRVAPDYDFDARPFRTERKDWLLEKIRGMTAARCDLVDHLLDRVEWDFFMVMEIGVDRMHHGFWNFHDPAHPKYQPGNPYENAIHDYYVDLDRRIGRWLERLGPETAVLVVSDHGAQPVEGWVCINEWLWREGYLALKEPPPTGRLSPFEKVEVDWARTRAWGAGGYYGRVFLNVKGREPEGAVPPNMVDALRDELAERLMAIPAPDGRPLRTRVFRPEAIYPEVRGIPPDLLVYFDNLRWRSSGSFGHDGIYAFENDTGPDECNHAENGLFILVDPRRPGGGQRMEGAGIMDVAPTVLDLLGLPVPEHMQGKLLRSEA